MELISFYITIFICLFIVIPLLICYIFDLYITYSLMKFAKNKQLTDERLEEIGLIVVRLCCESLDEKT